MNLFSLSLYIYYYIYKYPMFGTFNKAHQLFCPALCIRRTFPCAKHFSIFDHHTRPNQTRPDQNNTIFILIKIQLTNEKMFFLCSFVCEYVAFSLSLSPSPMNGWFVCWFACSSTDSLAIIFVLFFIYSHLVFSIYLLELHIPFTS